MHLKTTLKSWRQWLVGLCVGTWHVIVPGAGSAPDGPEHLRDTRLIILVMQPIILFSLAAVAFDMWPLWARGLIWSLSCLSVGFLAGFLFGIPRVLQETESPGPKAPEAGLGYRQRVNTNLEEISDWITKIIVGLGLYELKKIPVWVGELASAFGSSVGRPVDQRGFFGGTIIFFVVCGFLLGYLVTRLYLQGALGRADRATSGPDVGGAPKQTAAAAQRAGQDEVPEDEVGPSTNN
jgi:hypothetical protein